VSKLAIVVFLAAEHAYMTLCYLCTARPKGRAPSFSESVMTDILMPKATAVWLVDNTSLTFEQIADFCGLHPLEVKGIADGEVARDIRGADPIANGQLSREQLDAAQASDKYRMVAQKSRHAELLKPVKKAPRYTPVSRRQDRPDAIAWFIRNHPEVADSQIARLLGTTKATIESGAQPSALERGQHQAGGPGDARPLDPARTGRRGAQGGRQEGQGRRQARYRRARRRDPESASVTGAAQVEDVADDAGYEDDDAED
jgi:hypothetical protein